MILIKSNNTLRWCQYRQTGNIRQIFYKFIDIFFDALDRVVVATMFDDLQLTSGACLVAVSLFAQYVFDTLKIKKNSKLLLYSSLVVLGQVLKMVGRANNFEISYYLILSCY